MALPHTKFVAPPKRPEHLLRERQLERIDPHARLLLVSAPAGYGKTTLVGQWIARDERPTAWVQLAPEDDDVFAFWIAILSGLGGLRDGLGSRSLNALVGPVADIEALVLGPLIFDLCEREDPIGLVLDDFHAIQDPACHTTLAWLVDRVPESLRIAIATRTDPVLPLGRMRARGELTEMRAPDLRFDDAEVAIFFNEQLGLKLEPDHVAALAARTEGWPAGLYLAALSLRGVDDREAFVRAFAGDDRLVVDYLGPEVLRGLGDAQRSFLLRTSLLERFTAPLCDATLDLARGQSEQILVELERSNLFLVSLDRRRQWFRYHLLFRDLLRAELERVEPELVGELHRRAARWHAADGTLVEAIGHELAAGELEAAARHISAHWLTLYQSESWPVIPGWLKQLPERQVAHVPGFAVAKAWMLGINGRRDEVVRLADLAREHDTGEPLPDGSTSTESALAAIDAFFIYGDVGRARAAAVRAVELERGEAHRLSVMSALGITAFWAGLPEAQVRADLARVVPPADRLGESSRVALALAHIAYLDLLRGDADRARTSVQQAVTIAETSGKYARPFMCIVRIAHGWLALEEGRADEAEAELQRALELARTFGEPLHLANALRLLAECRGRAGDRTAAVDFIEEAQDVLAACADPGFLGNLVDQSAARVRKGGQRPSRRDGSAGLSEREVQVLRLLASKLSLPEIAAELYVSHNTMKTHCKAIYRKLGVSGRAEALARARELGLR